MASCPETIREGFAGRVEGVCAVWEKGGRFGGGGEVDEMVADWEGDGGRCQWETRRNISREEREEAGESGSEEVRGLRSQVVVEDG